VCGWLVREAGRARKVRGFLDAMGYRTALGNQPVRMRSFPALEEGDRVSDQDETGGLERMP
jgi:hypothetical protein